jgi:hypothetical protein
MRAMKPIPFDFRKDLAPLPFEAGHVELAKVLKRLGLPWDPHVGCFVWDGKGTINAGSPFPERIYFILSLLRFLGIFGSIEAVRGKLVWLPTWHQARLLCRRFGIEDKEIADIWTSGRTMNPGDELLAVYEKLADAFRHPRS